MTRILITGANGLIGTALVRLLLKLNDKDRKYHVIAGVRNKERAKARYKKELVRDDFEFLAGDVCDRNYLKDIDVDYIIHAGSPAHPKAFSETPVETMETAISGTRNILEYARHNPVKGIVYISTGEIYGHAKLPDENGFTEDVQGLIDLSDPRSCYPESKRAAEVMCVSYAKEYDINVMIARPGYIFGYEINPDNTRADSEFLRKVTCGEDIVLKSAGTQLRSYMYVNDAAVAIMRILLSGEKGKAYNVATYEKLTIREYAEKLAKAFGVGVGFDIPSSSEAAGYSKMKAEVLCPARLYELGFEPEYTIEEAFREMKSLA